MRRDYTNASGYFCPTENAVLYGREYHEDYVAPMRKPQTQTARYNGNEKAQHAEPRKDENLQQARQLFTALTAIAKMMGYSIEEITLKCRGERYANVGEAKTLVKTSC